MTSPKISEKHTKVVQATIPWMNLKSVLVEHVKAACSMQGHALKDLGAATIKIDIKQQERGSPAYKVDEWEAHVTLYFDLMPGAKNEGG